MEELASMCGYSSGLEIRRLTADWKQPLLAFFRALEDINDADFFQPHPFNDEAVEQILNNSRSDLFYVLVEGMDVVGYGMLRGWDEGYEIPSFGMLSILGSESIGLGRVSMHFLGAAAKCRRGPKLRLRVKPQNVRAVKLYESLGYEFRSEDDGRYFVGFLDLRSSRAGIAPKVNEHAGDTPARG